MLHPEVDGSATDELSLLSAFEVVAEVSEAMPVVEVVLVSELDRDESVDKVVGEVVKEGPADDWEGVVEADVLVDDVVNDVGAAANFAPGLSNPHKESVLITNIFDHLNSVCMQRTARRIRHEGCVPCRCGQICDCDCP